MNQPEPVVVPPKPQAAIDLEQKIKESMIELSKIKKRSIATLEGEEELKAAEEKRAP